MTWRRYLLRRAAFSLLLVLVASSAALVLTLLAPTECTAGQALDEVARHDCEEMRAAGQDRPILVQYVDWLSRALRFDFGTSRFYRGRAVADLLRERAFNTAVLAAVALVIATALGIPLGIFTAVRQRGLGVTLVRIMSTVMLSMPPLLASLALVLLAARTGWLPTGGMTSADAVTLPWGAWLLDVARHVPLPALALALPLAATLERLQSQAMTEAADATFVRAARARGVAADAALLRHAWPSSLKTVLGVYGLMIGTLFSGSFAVEVITAWPGLGRLMFDALRGRDLYLVAGCAATGACFLAVGMLIADALLATVDPRARLGARA
jgi:peptide/nickel transport system permease protein